jgi:hypothetical protein
MHIAPEDLAKVTAGPGSKDFAGSDNRTLQSAVDYVAPLGGGVVEVLPGEFLMRDSLHLRPNVTIRGTPGRTVLRKAKSASSKLHLDGDYGEEQVTLEKSEGFEIGDGLAVWDRNAGGFHTTGGANYRPEREHVYDQPAFELRLHGRK